MPNIYIVLLLLSVLFSNAFAFKVKTHVWVGQEVINDLKDGELEFKLDNKTIKLPIDSKVKNAILNNQTAYLLGNIGPDAAPDVVVGQSYVHPGSSGLTSGEWFKHLLKNSNGKSDRALAYTYGYIAHGAADTFAHTYVDQYVGGCFRFI